MKRDERHIRILDLLKDRERLEVDVLADEFNVSVETIRRDLTTLSEQGMLRKVHGGAVRFQTAREQTFSLRSQVNRAAKEAIGQHMTRLIEDGDSLFLNAGTTTAIFAEQAVHRRRELTVITNCAAIAHTMWGEGDTDHRVYLLGGAYNGIDTETSGSQVIDQLQTFQVDHAIVAIGAMDTANGPMEYRVEAAEIIRVMFRQAQNRAILVDHSKLGKTALVKICDFDTVDQVVTDRLPSDSLQEALSRSGVQLHVSGLIG